ncbi:hypothetical protein BH20CHL3_BH20CHL3_05310 [soil metagenome]
MPTSKLEPSVNGGWLEPMLVKLRRPPHSAADSEPTRPTHTVLSDWLWLAMAMLLSLALRIPFFKIPMLADEGGYAYATRGWVDGAGQLYHDLWISRPQGIFFVYAGIFDLFGSDTTAIRFAAWIAIALTTIAVWGFARMCVSPSAGNLAAAIFAVASSLPNLEGYSANAEMFMGLPAALAALWLLHLGRTSWSPWQLVGTGLLIGIAISLKPSAAVMIAVAIGFIYLIGDTSNHTGRLKRTTWLLTGVAIVGIGSAIHGWMLGWDEFFEATVSYRLSAQSAVTVGVQRNLEAIGRLAWRASALIALTAILLVVRYRAELEAAGRWLGAASRSAGRSPLRWRSRWPIDGAVSHLARPVDDGKLLLRLWMLGSLAGASVGGDWWSHYLIQIVPPLSIWMGWTIVKVWPTLTAPFRPALAIATVVLLMAPFWVLVHGSPTDMARTMFSHPGYPAQEQVAAYLREETTPDTEIYVAFDQASIYYLADRPPAYRYLYDQELRGIPSSYSDLISIISGPNRPEYIVSTRQPGPFADDSRAFWQVVGQYYERVVTIDDVPIYRDKTAIDAEDD